MKPPICCVNRELAWAPQRILKICSPKLWGGEGRKSTNIGCVKTHVDMQQRSGKDVRLGKEPAVMYFSRCMNRIEKLFGVKQFHVKLELMGLFTLPTGNRTMVRKQETF